MQLDVKAGMTVKAIVLLVPPAVVTAMLFWPVVAPLATVSVPVICVELTTLMALTEMPLGVLIAAPEIKPVPVRTTGTEAPVILLEGVMEVSVGVG